MNDKKYYFEVSYSLYVGPDDELMESTSPGRPLNFYSGAGMMLERFEEQMLALEEGGEFDFVIPCAEAYGEYDEGGVIDLPAEIFDKGGDDAKALLVEGGMVPLVDSEGNRVDASVVSLGDGKVTVDLNHPLAGEDLHFVGRVELKREASDEEIEQAMSHSCGCGCDSCGDGCGDSDCGDDGCGCGHCH